MAGAERFEIAVEIGAMAGEAPAVERVAALAEAGHSGIACADPWDLPGQAFRDALLFAGLPLVSIDAPPPNYTGGAPGWAADPETVDRFRRDWVRVLRLADVLRPTSIHLRTGAVTGAEAEACLIDNLRHVATAAPTRQVTITPGDGPLVDDGAVRRVLGAVGSQAVGTRLDLRAVGGIWDAFLPEAREVVVEATASDAWRPRLSAAGFAGRAILHGVDLRDGAP
ncbi:MAG: hydroxypyruvate isomerase family protein [Shimia sp.]